MNQCVHRLSTFVNWPLTAAISPTTLAWNGFVYVGVGDRVRCYLCFLELDGWQNGDDPVARHRQVNPDCPVALYTDSLNDAAEGLGVGGGQSPLSADDADAVVPRVLPLNTRLHSFAARLATFKNWPKSGVVRAVDLARAGLWHTGEDDEVRCAFCQTTCRDWKYGDLPADEHRRLAPHCPFVRADFCRTDVVREVCLFCR